MLISNGANVNQTVNSWTPLDIASLNGHEEIVKLLIDYDADVNLSTQEGMSARELALKNGKILKCHQNKNQRIL